MGETVCQTCSTHLEPGSRFRCSHGCTFYGACADRLDAVCPNCSGNLHRDTPPLIR